MSEDLKVKHKDILKEYAERLSGHHRESSGRE